MTAVEIAAVAFCPHPPLLVAPLGAGAAGELDDLRRACLDALVRIATPDRVLVLLGPADEAATFGPDTAADLGRWGPAVPVGLGGAAAGRVALPLSLAVGAWLRGQAFDDDRPALGLGVTASGLTTGQRDAVGRFAGDRPVALLVLGDGSARRSRTAPGYLDERAARFDDDVRAALASGEPDALAALDAELGADLLASGVPAWHAAASLLGPSGRAAGVVWSGDPYGVAYTVAGWGPA